MAWRSSSPRPGLESASWSPSVGWHHTFLPLHTYRRLCRRERGLPHSFPGEALIWLTQSMLTYYSDVATLGQDSLWHGLDRVHAYSFTATRAVFTVFAYWHYGSYSTLQIVILATGLAIGLCCIRLSWLAVMRRRCRPFLRWHAAWHASLPAAAVLIALLHRPSTLN